MTDAAHDAQVLIVGAGPVGMTLALDLASRGIDVTLVERRAPGDPADAKCNTTAARTMEVFRRLGVADTVRASGLADEYPTDVSFRTAVTGPEILRLELPSRSERLGPDGRSAPGYLDSHWATPEPVVRISQLYLDPLLRDAVEKRPGITIRPQTAFERYEDAADGVTVHCRDLTTNEPLSLRARYLVGCDGGTSPVRKQMGVELLGDAEISRTRSSLIRSKDLKRLMQGRPAWMTWTVSEKGTGVVVAIDGDELWLVHRNLRGGQRDFEDLDREQALRDVLGVGDGFRYEVVAHQDWVGRRLVAGRFRRGSVFIAGDAAHLWIPIAGYGMNAGIADAMNLSWMLAAVLQGWAPEALLDAHERERHPITEQVSRFAMAGAEQLIGNTRDRRVPRALGWRGPIGALLRSALGRRIRAVNEAQFACEGPQLRILLRRLADRALRRRSRTGLHHGRVDAVDGARLPDAALLARCGDVGLRRAGRVVHPPALRSRCRRERRHRGGGCAGPAARGPRPGAARPSISASATLSCWCAPTSTSPGAGTPSPRRPAPGSTACAAPPPDITKKETRWTLRPTSRRYAPSSPRSPSALRTARRCGASPTRPSRRSRRRA